MSKGMRKDNYHFKINNIMYYEITDRVTRMKDDGTEKETNERYITDCLTFAEAERKEWRCIPLTILTVTLWL